MEKHTYVLKKTKLIYLMIGCLCLIYIFSNSIREAYGIEIINDEFGYWGIAASISGKDWSNLLSNTPYYSFGYSILLVPLYKLGLQPQTMYQIALVGNLVLILCSYLLTYWCGKELFANISSLVMAFLSFAITVYSNNIVQAKVAWTETLLYCLYWALIALLLQFLKKERTFDLIIFSICNVYMYYVHQRTVGILLSSILISVLFVINKKMSKKQFMVFILIMIITIKGGSCFKNYIIDTLFTNKELVNMNNYGGQVTKAVSIFSSLSNLLMLLQSIIGKLYYVSVSTFLIGIISLIALCKETYINCVELIENKFQLTDNKKIVPTYIFISFCATFLISAISMYQPDGRLDLLLYGRYSEIVIGPILLVGFAYIMQDRLTCIQYIGIIVNLILAAVWVDYVYVSLNTTNYNGICISVLGYFFENMSQVSGLSFWIAVVSIVPLLIFVIVNWKQRQKKYRNIVFLLIMSVVWIQLSTYVDIESEQKRINTNIVSISEEIKKEYEQSDREIYIINNEGTANVYSKYLQYFLYNDTVKLIELQDVVNLKNIENAIFITCNDTNEIEYIPFETRIVDKTNWLTIFIKR